LFNRKGAMARSNAMEKQRFEYLANQIFLSSLEVHKYLGPGLLESVYVFGLIKEFQIRNLLFDSNVKVPLFYKGHDTGKEFFMDLLIENEIVIELKCVDLFHPVHLAQILSYMKLADKKLGFLINFNVELIKNGFKRVVNNY
jgi:GxxExxY protein